ncbi:MAG: rod shape-determining protein MreD [Hominenteromicrobium sp.]
MADRKKWIRYLLYTAELLLLFVLQETPGLLPFVMGAKPMLVLAAALTVAMVEECVPAMAFGIFAGLLADFGGGTPMGYHALVFAVLCFFLSGLCGTRIQIHLFTAVLMGLWSCAAAVVLDWLVLYVAQGYSLAAYALLNAYLPIYFYTLLMIPVCYGLQALIRRFFSRFA